MKTFEEQFTAWIDDRLPADELATFERNLAARPDVLTLHAEKRMALRLRDLLRENLAVPALSNPDFFNHGIMERIAAEERQAAAAVAPRRAAWWNWDWTPARLLATGAACLLTALVGVRTLIPTGNNGGTSPSPAAAVAQNGVPKVPAVVAVVTPTPTPEPVEVPRGPGSKNDGMEARNNVQPPPVPLVDPAPVPVPAAAMPSAAPASPVTATPLHFDEGDADVIWLDGTDYLPNLDNAASPSPAAPAAPR